MRTAFPLPTVVLCLAACNIVHAPDGSQAERFVERSGYVDARAIDARRAGDANGCPGLDPMYGRSFLVHAKDRTGRRVELVVCCDEATVGAEAAPCAIAK